MRRFVDMIVGTVVGLFLFALMWFSASIAVDLYRAAQLVRTVEPYIRML